MEDFWNGFEKAAARKGHIMDRIRAYINSRQKGHSIKSIFSTRMGKDLIKK